MFLASAPNILLVSLCACCLLAGLYLASLAVHLHSQAKRYVPEPLCFAVLALQGALPAGVYPTTPATGSSHQRQLAAEDPRWLAIAATDAGVAYLPATAEGIEALDIVQVLSSSSGAAGDTASDEYWASAAFKTSAAAAAVRLVGRCTELLAGNVALPEVLAPAQEVLRSIVAAAEAQLAAAAAQPGEAQQQQKKQKNKKKGAAAAAPQQLPRLAEPAATLAPGLVQLSREVLQQIQAAIEAVRSSRRPMYNVQLLKVAEKRQFNPRFEEDFVSGKDYDPDR
jgi:nucleolar protein 14